MTLAIFDGGTAAGTSVTDVMAGIGHAARAAQRVMATAEDKAKTAALRTAAVALRRDSGAVLAANQRDMADGEARGLTAASLDRLRLDAVRVQGIAAAVEAIASLPDPVGRLLARYERPNGLMIERVATPLGVVGVIYESRPNVTADAGALCLKAGNAAILRGGSESFRSSAAIHACLIEGLRAAGLPEAAISLVPTRDREAVGLMLAGLDRCIDVIVPRGGKPLVERVEREARVPVFAHLEGLVHVYVDRAADLDKACRILVNAKLRRTGVCGAAETLLVDRAVAASHLPRLIDALIEAGCAVRGDAETAGLDSRVEPAAEEDWRTEYLDSIIAVRVVDGLEAAIDHIETYGSHHTDAIITEDPAAAETFLARVDSAIVMHNASTQFADGGEFGFGGEIGIATGRMHARGPVGVEQLTSFNYRVRGTGTDPAVKDGPWRFPILPPHGRGLRIGLFGGSFNPPHDGHRLASLAAMRRLGLDRIWWLVTPGNPLKTAAGLPSLATRIAAAKAMSHHPRIDVTGVEAALGMRFSVETVDYLKRRCPGTRFVWIMGADILAELHRWRRWREFLAAIPVAVVDRPGSTFNATRGKAATLMSRGRLRESEAGSLPDKAPPAFVFIHGPRSAASSTRLRARRA